MRKATASSKTQILTKNISCTASGLKNTIKEGDSVSYDLQEGKKGLNAVNVKLV
jgi:cold shock CspA family protein